MGVLRAVIGLIAALGLAACSDPAEGEPWAVVHEELPEALLSVWGTSADDVWAVGGDIGAGPLVLHFDGAGWERLDTSAHPGDLWWVTGFAGGAVYMGGEAGRILRYEGGAFTAMETPADTGVVFGIWGASPEEMWAVGGAQGGARGAFAWRLEEGAWVEADGVPAELVDGAALWKVYGRAADDVWMVGTNGAALRWDGVALTRDDAPTGESLFTLHASADRFVAVGGFGTGQIFEHDGISWQDVSPVGVPPLVGVYMTEAGGWAVGQQGTILRQVGGEWVAETTGLPFFETLHAVWVDPEGGVWAVGGQVQVAPLVRGALLHRGEEIPGGIL